jgi:Tol biopolymer transport system component
MHARPVAVAALFVTISLSGMAQQAGNESKAENDLPLEAGRTVAIETDEGSWLSLDVSPNGETIVFDLLGDLYTLPIAGGDATPLTEGMAYDSQPRYSPDGATLLLVSDRDGAENLWLIDVETEKTTQITKGKTSSYESPEWLPDSLYVVAAKANHALVGGAGRNPKLWM